MLGGWGCEVEEDPNPATSAEPDESTADEPCSICGSDVELVPNTCRFCGRDVCGPCTVVAGWHRPINTCIECDNGVTVETPPTILLEAEEQVGGGV